MKYSLIFIFVFCAIVVNAQETALPDSTLVQIEMKDGNIFVGYVVQEDENQLIFKTTNLGDLTIKKLDIRTRSYVKDQQIINGEFWFENPHSTRYFWGPSGYGLKTGEAYYQNTWVMFNQVSVGINEHFSMGVGTLPIFLFGAGVIPVWVTPKVSYEIKKDKLNVGGGVLAATVVGEVEAGVAGIAYGVSTWGSKDSNFTLGVGYGFSPDGWANRPTFTLSGMKRLSRKGYFLTENYFIGIDGEYVGLLSAGFRSVGKRLALDFGGFVPVGADIDAVVVLPWLGVNIPFGRLSAQ